MMKYYNTGKKYRKNNNDKLQMSILNLKDKKIEDITRNK